MNDATHEGTSNCARLGVDLGTVRIGLAINPANVSLAVPLETLERGPGDISRIVAIVNEQGIGEVYIGDPLRLNGEIGPAALAARAFAQTVADSLANTLVMMIDERLTTAQSSKQMRSAGRNTRKARTVLDQAAAVAILQNAMDTVTTTGKPAGKLVRPQREPDA